MLTTQRSVSPNALPSIRTPHQPAYPGVVSAPLWNSERSEFAGMFTVSDIIHLIQYYYHTSSYDSVAEDVENFRLESLRGVFALQVPLTPPFSR